MFTVFGNIVKINRRSFIFRGQPILKGYLEIVYDDLDYRSPDDFEGEKIYQDKNTYEYQQAND